MQYARQGRHEEFMQLVKSGHFQRKGRQELQKGTTPAAIASEEHHRSERAITVTSPLNNYWDVFWTGTVGFGTPAQYFPVIFDTGSANLWVMDSTCTVSDCSGNALFNSSASSSYQPDGTSFSIGYGSGYADGFVGVDTWVLQGGSGSTSLAISGMPFAQTNDSDGDGQGVSGILGLAWQALSVNNLLQPVQYALQAGAFQQALFTAYLQTAPNSNGATGGQITFGGLDTTNCGAVIGYAPLTDESYWQFNVSKVAIGSTSYQTTAGTAISDTGTTLILGPSATVSAIASAVGATWSSSSGTYTVACNKQYSPVSFTINGNAYNLTYKALTLGYDPTNSGQCLFGISPGTDGGSVQWLFGDPFIRQYCTVYDVGNKRIGFAPTKGM